MQSGRLFPILVVLFVLPPRATLRTAPATRGYYRFPALHGDTVVFTAEGDLWLTTLRGGTAIRLTTHPGQETNAAISPDGKTIAFSATYEGPTDVYTMPIGGGLPTRRTWQGDAQVTGWTPDGKVLYATRSLSTLPNWQLATIDLQTSERDLLPLSQASDGSEDETRKTLYFTRFAFQGSHTKRYQGGTAQNLWKYVTGAPEAVPLTADYVGTSKTPMWWKGRLYFASDRDGTMNLWAMDSDGRDLKQLTHHQGWDVRSPALDNGRIVYQLGADLHLFDITSGQDRVLDITLASDFDQTRERWIKNPMDYLTSAHLSPDGDRVVLDARGQLFVAPTGQSGGRLVEASRNVAVRYRQARFDPDGKTILTLSDQSGETEWWRLPANGVGAGVQLTRDARVMRWDGAPSPDGKWLTYYDKNSDLWLFNLDRRLATKIDSTPDGDFQNVVWSPDSRWLAYVRPTATFGQIWLYGVVDGRRVAVTTDRVDSYSPVFTPDGKWLYFLSDRTLRSLVGAPWGPRQPEPFFDRQTKIYHVALAGGLRSPFQPADELQPKVSADTGSKKTPSAPALASAPTRVDLNGLAQRLYEVPVPAGNYEALAATGTRLFYLSRETSLERKASLLAVDIGNVDVTPKTLVDGLQDYELSADGKKLLVHKGTAFFIIDATSSANATLDKPLDLTGWAFAIDPRVEWQQMFTEAWRLERDYFYDPHMHGLDWVAIRDKYRPLVDRVTDRDELADVLAQMVSELSALHIFVFGGDQRVGRDSVFPGSLGAVLTRDTAAGGYQIAHIYRSDPDYPDRVAPLAKPGLGIDEGDVIETINGTATLSVPDPAVLLRRQAGKQVLLRIRQRSTARAASAGARDVIVTAMTPAGDRNLRYDEWEFTRRQFVDSVSAGRIGYVHLRAMGENDIAQWARDYYPVFARQGLIVDVRHNQGGNIDSWILEKLMRKAWFYWQGRVGNPTWNMQWAFRGHIVVLCDQHTASDGEAFAEGFRRLGLGKVIGTRTWGGEIWLSFSNWLVDRGIATSAEFGVYGPEGAWLIEGHGVDPDSAVDNAPHATFLGQDAQLHAALDYLTREISQHPVAIPAAPAYPKKVKQ